MHRISRRRALAVAGAAVAAGAGLWAANSRAPAGALPQGWFLVARTRTGSDSRELVAQAAPAWAEHILDAGAGMSYQALALSPDGRFLALLKRVPRGSMPNDSISIYDRRDFTRLSEKSVEVPFQSTPTFALSWSADSRLLAVPYNTAGRTFVFGVSPAGLLSLKALLDYGFVQFHPTQASLFSSEAIPPDRAAISLIDFVPGQPERVRATIDGHTATWSPDGRLLACLVEQGAAQTLVIRTIQPAGVSASLNVHGAVYAWSPDSRRLAVFTHLPRDPFHLAGVVPDGMLPGFRPAQLLPCLLVFDSMTGQSVTTYDLPQGTDMFRLQWLDDQWLLVLTVDSSQSCVMQRDLGARRPVPINIRYASVLLWASA